MSPAPANALRFKRALLKWFRANGRDLPWRATRDPYRIAVSEFMLQQTQVSRVLDYYPRFLRRFPTLEALAKARPRAVREAWEGLGYYRRAENLHRLARTVVREHAGTIPAAPEELETLPGVGRYTAGAIATFAYERRAPAVDTNVARVLGRVFRTAGRRAGNSAERRNGSSAERRNGGTAERRLWELAERLLPRSPRVAWEFNQALMDLGARVCVARKPRCAECPVRAACHTGTRPQ
ncbi:MAG: A/G-specific adenine glycosylase [Gemmatimonadota bacterium]|nr:A/G-specific adenine glycosylase [Gemmatimonadota bacterium]MDH5198226.1 A/G-specific adenine glycosylase [Gemmatimonadota bacterium]